MSKSNSDASSPGRYYASPQEQKILIQGLQNYFALPERSQNRNKIAKEVSRFLRLFSPHWTHRAVRLWFNNNRYTYFPADPHAPPGGNLKQPQPSFPHPGLSPPASKSSDMGFLPRPPPPPPPPPRPPPAPFPTTQQPFPSFKQPQPFPVQQPVHIPSTLPPEILPPKLQGSPQTPPGSPRTRLIVPTSPVSSFPLSPNSLPPAKSPPQKTVSVVPIPGPTQSGDSGIQFQSLKPVSFWQPGQTKEQTPEQLYIPMSTMLNELRRMSENDPRLPGQINDFDSGCLRIISKFGAIKPEKIEPMLKYVRFPFPTGESSEFKFGLISESISSEFSEFAIRAPSFTQQLYAADMPRDFSSEQFAPNNIWQTRSYEDTKVGYFENAALTKECAAFVSPPVRNQPKFIQFLKYREPSQQWHRIPLELPGSVNTMCLSSQFVWILCDSVVRGIPLSRVDTGITTRLPIFGCGNLAAFRDGVAVGFPTVGTLLFVNSRGTVRSVAVRYMGITCMTTVSDTIVCGINQSGTIRLLNPDGHDERACVGHCGPVSGLERMSDTLFASRAEDETVRIWDIRQQNPVSSVLLPHVSVYSITGSPGHLICGFHNKRIGVVELRKDHGKAILGVQTQDYMPVALSYDPLADSLAMFGAIDKEPMQNSMVFVESDGQNSQRIFRRYSHFIGADLV